MKNTVIRLKRETSKSLYSISSNNGLVGYLLKVNVDIWHNIDPNIFVMQRDVGSSYGDEPVDTFYSIASVGELETLSIDQPNTLYSNFYRTKEIQLMFETPQELESAWNSISAEVRELVEANDLSINSEIDVIASYPVDAFPRYFGSSVLATPSETAIKSLFESDSFYGVVPEIIGNSIQLTQPEYYFFATTDLNAQIKILVDNVSVSISSTNLNITNKYGLIVPYKVFKTQNTIQTGLHLIDIKNNS